MPKSKVVPQFKVGDVIYVRFEYNVLYRKYHVGGETSRSWLISQDAIKPTWQPYVKLPKTMKNVTIGTEQDAKLAEWASSNRWKIGQAVDRQTDCHVLLAIAKLINHFSLEELEATHEK